MPEMAAQVKFFLETKAINKPELSKLIKDGLYLIKHPVEDLNTKSQ
ncbi:MAG: hypothetical protein JWQ06_1452, partial [Mucilaginibacter sp.]|nr:hypothetical protein [Mucilaginibacter sp.]